MSPRMVPLTVCARREYIAASTRLVHITARNMFMPTDVFSILFCRCGVIYPLSVSSQVENTEYCYHTLLGKVKSPISQLYNFACAPAPPTDRSIGKSLFGPADHGHAWRSRSFHSCPFAIWRPGRPLLRAPACLCARS